MDICIINKYKSLINDDRAVDNCMEKMILDYAKEWVHIDLKGEGNGSPLQYSCLENPVDRGAWWAAVHGVTQSRTRLKRLSVHACIKKEMATHSSILSWRIPEPEKPGGLPSMELDRVGHD